MRVARAWTIVALIIFTAQIPHARAASQRLLEVTTTPELDGLFPQMLSGKNDSRTLAVKGNYTLQMTVNLPADPAVSCPEKPGRMAWEVGLIAFVQSHTAGGRTGSLSIEYDKLLAPSQGQVDSWITTIGDYEYTVAFFRWASATFSEVDSTTTVFYRGGSIEVFKKKGGRFISREQCFGNYVDYDLTVRSP